MNKGFKSINDRLSTLESRHIKFKNKNNAYLYLIKYNYFDVINSLEDCFIDKAYKNKVYIENLYFEDFIEMHKLNCLISTNILNMTIDLESRLKTSISYRFCELHCRTLTETNNYMNSSYYIRPQKNKNKALYNMFISFRLFDPNHINSLRKKHPYMNSYSDIPMWIALKGFEFGSISYLFQFLEPNIKNSVLKDLNMDKYSLEAIYASIYFIKEYRNKTAHNEEILRYSTNYNNLFNYSYLINEFKLNKSNFTLKDLLIILKNYGYHDSIRSIKKTILLLYIKYLIQGRKHVFKRVLSKMGSSNILNWIKL